MSKRSKKFQRMENRGGAIFLNLATQSLISAGDNFNLKKYAESTHYSVSAIEYTFKAVSRYLNCTIGRIHDVSEDFGNMLERLPPIFRKDLIEFTEVGYSIQNTRQLSEYGLPDAGIPPDQIFNKNRAEKWENDAKQAYKFATSVIRAKVLSDKMDTIKVGILNGTVNNSPSENACPALFSRYSVEDWEKALNEKKITFDRISVNQLCDSYQLVINPFGEVYPEEDYNVEPPKSFQKILIIFQKEEFLLALVVYLFGMQD